MRGVLCCHSQNHFFSSMHSFQTCPVGGLVQGSDSEFWSGHRIAWVKFFFLNQNDVVLVKKKKKSTGCNRVFDRVLPGQPGTSGFFFPYFFFIPARFQPRIGRSRVNPSGRAEFQKYASMLLISWWNFDILVSNHLLSAVCFCILKIFEKNYFFIYFCIFISFWCADVKNNFLKVKNIILMCFQIKNTLKNNNY